MVGERAVARRPRTGDVALAVVCSWVPLVELHVERGTRSAGADALVAVLLVLAGAALLLRRHMPVLVTFVSGGAALGCLALGDRSPLIALGLTVALYSVGVAGLPMRAIVIVTLAAGTAFVLGVLLETRRATFLHDLGHVAAVVTPVMVGRLVAVQRMTAQLRTERAELALQAERDAHDLRIEQERRRIARDLHDVVGHALTTITVQAGVAARLLDTRPEFTRQALQEISAAGGEALRDLRGVVGMLRGSESDNASDREPSLDDVERLVQRARAMGVEGTLAVTGPTAEVPRSIQVAVYRIVQEALTNVRRHAGARVATEVEITVSDGEIGVEVRNAPGAVPNPSPGRRVEGAGLNGMRERVAAVGGSLAVGPTPDGGFCVAARIPLPVTGAPGGRA